MSKHLKSKSLACFLLTLLPPFAYADAWTQPAGHGQVIFKLGYMSIDRQFDGSGAVQPLGDHGKFRKLEINPYLEYGITRATTVIVNAFIPSLEYSNDFGRQKSAGMGDVEVGIRRRLNSPEMRTAMSAQFSVQFPAYSLDRNPAPGNRQADVESRLMVGRGFTLSRRHGFVSGGAAYRYRSDAPADQFRFDASAGIDLSSGFMVFGQMFGITGLRNGTPIHAITNPNLRSDFDLYKTQLSLVTRITRSVRVQCAWADAVAGRNTGNGHAFLIGVWKDF